MKLYKGILDGVWIIHGRAYGKLRDSQLPVSFPDGSEITTSEIVFKDKHIIETKNSIYFVGRKE